MRRRDPGRAAPATRTVAVVCGAWHVPALDPAVDHGDGRRRRAARPPEGQGRGHVGAVDAPAARPGHGLRRRRRQPRLVRPRVPPPRRRRACPGSSSTPPTPCAATACRRRPTTSSPRRAWPRRWPRCAAGRAPGWPRCSTPPTRCSAASRSSLDELVVGDAIGEVPPGGAAGAAGPRPRRRPAGGPAASRTSSTRTVELDLRTPNGLRRSHLLHRLVALGVPWGVLRGGPGVERHVPRDVAAWRGSPSCRCASSSWPATAPRSRRRRRRGSSSGRPRAGRLADAAAAVELALLADLPGRAGAGRARARRAGRPRARRRRADGRARPAGRRAALRRRARHRRGGAARRVRRAGRAGRGRPRPGGRGPRRRRGAGR